MKISRRDLIHAGCTVAGVTLVPTAFERAEAFVMRGGLATAVPSGFALSGRNIINIDALNVGTTEYAMINHLLPLSAIGPNLGDFGTTNYPSVLDAAGWPNNAAANGSRWGGGFWIPDPANFAGPYTLQWKGQGVFACLIQMGGTATWTQTATPPTNCSITFNAGGSLQITSNSGATTNSIEFTVASTGTGPQLVQWWFQGTGGAGGFVTDAAWLRSADAHDFSLGNIWRSPWKQPLVDLCPSAIRFMNILGGNADMNCRFENRTLPTDAGYGRSCQWTKSPVYSTRATGTNQFACVAANPTASNPKTTPTSMLHGEIATMQFTNGFARCTTGLQVTGITNASNGVAATTKGALSSLAWSGGTVTATTTTNHNLGSPGTVATLGIAGVTPSGYNGSFSCTVTGPTTFTYAVASNPGTETVPGIWGIPHGYNTGDVIAHSFGVIDVLATMSSNATLSSIVSTSGIFAGMYAFGPGLPANTTVVSVSSSTVGLSNNSTLTRAQVGVAFRAMNNLHLFPCTITVVDVLSYQLNVNTSAMGTFSAGSGVTPYQFATLQVGSGNDRTAYPITLGDSTPTSQFGDVYLQALDYKTFSFDKTLYAQTDGSGNPVMGCWMMDSTPFQNTVAHSGDFPIEVCIALINELNAMSPAHTIGMHMNIPAWTLCSMDPDYSSASDWAVNAVDVVMNPASSVRTSGYNALGYSGATKLNSPVLILEYSNELWFSGANNSGVGYMINRGIARWGNSILPYSDYQDMKALRSTCWVRDVKATNPPNASQIKYVIGMWGFVGFVPGGFAANYETAFGGPNGIGTPSYVGDWYNNDTLVTTNSWGSPIDNHDGVSPANYFDPPDTYYSATGTGSFTDDSAMFAGTTPYSSPNQAQAITNFVAQVVDASNVNHSQSTTQWASVLIPQYSTNLPAGKIIVGYEGGPDWQTVAGSQQGVVGNLHTLTPADSLFSIAVINSSQWATAQVNYFNAVNAVPKSYMPALYYWIQDQVGNQRWAYCAPDSYATISGTPTEGAALTVNSPVWIAMGNRNQGLAN